MQKGVEIIEKIEKIIFGITILLFPLVFFPQAVSPFDTPKLLFLIGAISLTLLLYIIKTILKASFSLTTSNLDIPVLLLTLIYLVSGLIKTPNKPELFFQPGVSSFFILGAFLFGFSNSLFGNSRKPLKTLLFLSGVGVSLISLLIVSGLTTKIPGIPAFLKNTTFSTVGSKLPESLFLIVILPLGVATLISETSLVRKFFYGACVGIITLNLALSVYKMVSDKTNFPTLPSWSASWSVAIDTLKESPFVGIGPANYPTAYNRFRPLTTNLETNWQAKFSIARDFFLTNLTEVGLIGFAILFFLLFRIHKLLKKDFVFLSLGILILSFLLFPGYPTLVITFFLLLSLASTTRNVEINLKVADESPLISRIPAILIAVLVIGASGTVDYFAGRSALAEYKFGQSLTALSTNQNANIILTNLGQAILFNPSVDRYHITASQIYLILASNIVGKKDLTDQDKTNINQLIQAAISDAKAAATLNPQRSDNWQNLAVTYRSIMSFAQGADNFTIQSYNQAIALDPINPDLRISLGNIFYALGRFDDAITSFQLATYAKSDYANAHYNLAQAYKQKGEFQKAYDSLNTALTLLKPDSPDYATVKNEISEVEKKLPSQAPAQGTEQPSALTTPKPAEKPVIQPPLELPKEASPPASP